MNYNRMKSGCNSYVNYERMKPIHHNPVILPTCLARNKCSPPEKRWSAFAALPISCGWARDGSLTVKGVKCQRCVVPPPYVQQSRRGGRGGGGGGGQRCGGLTIMVVEVGASTT